MKNIAKNNLHIILATFSFFVLQIIVSPLLSIYNIAPDFMLILVITYATLNDHIPSMLYAFIVGIFMDLYLSTNFGSLTLQYLLASFIASYFKFNSVYYIKQFIYKFIFVVFIASITSSLSFLFLNQTIVSYLFFYNFINLVIFNNLYNVIIAFIIITILPGKLFYEIK
ncbi:MAG TPA: rod shape-determining protein MreD [Ignavibacteriales bacterium]|nr:rod shape-determining protein MreD [Ignavibacteriales bacterium]HOL81089.1 rod shape-determining protein MreD [Ignavibacteriales bacterium]HOM66151.1 rod shape-determining protein MreD [Ignavibacteriales bacterium]HPD66485.1 rod shape-determining protein MreD [Ignavibacteriales bacterium]HPP34466.1 rod shape-determining protein MreD [Ignavibacteriales bacterium]